MAVFGKKINVRVLILKIFVKIIQFVVLVQEEILVCKKTGCSVVYYEDEGFACSGKVSIDNCYDTKYCGSCGGKISC